MSYRISKTNPFGQFFRKQRQRKRLTLSIVSARTGLPLEELQIIEGSETNPVCSVMYMLMSALEK